MGKGGVGNGMGMSNERGDKRRELEGGNRKWWGRRGEREGTGKKRRAGK